MRLATPSDMAAWEEFVRLYSGAIRNYCLARGLQEADVEEIVQEVLLLVHRRIADWKPSGHRKSFRTWLLRTAHRMCLESIRAKGRIDRAAGGTSMQQRVQNLAGDSDQTSEDSELDWHRWAFQWAARQIQSEVAATTWQAFWLTAVENLSAEETADRLSIKVGSVYTNKCRVLSKIRDRIRNLSRIEE